MYHTKKKNTFNTTDKYLEYINWKAIHLLRRYMTRFGNIKAREYTNSSVKTQKAIRQSIIRAREIGLLEYTK